MVRRPRALVAAASLVLAATVLPSVPAAADPVLPGAARATPPPGDRLASDFPRIGTPHVMDGAVRGIAQVGDRIVVVGSFTRVSPAATYHRRGDDLTRRHVFAFDARTGAIDRSFAVSLSGGEATAVDTDGTHVYVGGDFTRVDGRGGHARLVKLTPSGAVVPAFRASARAAVETLVVRGGRVYVGGAFDSIRRGGRDVPRRGLAALATRDGAVLGAVRVPFTGVHTTRFGRSKVRRLDVSADGSRLVAIGNFTKVGGRSRPQVAVLDLRGRQARVTGWRAERFDARRNRCSQRFGSFVRDVDLAPSGTWFVVATTGGYGGGARSGTLCDTVSRWSVHQGRRPAWVAHTGGDTTTGVEVARGAVYVGGHMRWFNNPFAKDRAGPGAVPRPGLAALDPLTGVPLSWNPGRARGVGAEAFLATAEGLWVGSDTTLLADQRRGRIALLPWDGGRPIPRTARVRLPGELFVAPRRGELRQRPLRRDGTASGPARRVPTGLDWSKVRGATYVAGELYYGWADGGLFRRRFDPATGELGPRRVVRTRRLPFPSRRLSGLFHDPVSHRLHYTVAGDRRVYSRAFSVESHVLGAVEQVSDRRGTGLERAAGVTLVGDRLLYGSRDGVLRSVAFRGGRVVGAPRRLNGDGTWRARGLFVPGS